jgi:hypothetical protein
VYLAYLDDSGTKDKRSRYQVVAGVVVEGWEFSQLELAIGVAISQLVPQEKMEKFSEFHAWEFFNSEGPFEGVPVSERDEVISGVLGIIESLKIPIVYGAVNLPMLDETVWGSVEPVDLCFRTAMYGINSWATAKIRMPAETQSEENQDAQALVVLVSDDYSDKGIKNRVQTSFRKYRKKVLPPSYSPGPGWHLHDSLYFGDSKDSVGLQMADIIAYIVRRRLEGDRYYDGLFEKIRSLIVFSKTYDRVEASDSPI